MLLYKTHNICSKQVSVWFVSCPGATPWWVPQHTSHRDVSPQLVTISTQLDLHTLVENNVYCFTWHILFYIYCPCTCNNVIVIIYLYSPTFYHLFPTHSLPLSQVQQTLEARAASFVGPPPPAFVGPGELDSAHIHTNQFGSNILTLLDSRMNYLDFVSECHHPYLNEPLWFY